MAAVELGQVFGSSLPVSAANGYYSPLSHAQHSGSSGQSVDAQSWEAAQPLNFRSSSLPSTQNNLQTPFKAADWFPHTGENLEQREAGACLAHNKTPEQADASCQSLHVHSPEPNKTQQTVEQPQPLKATANSKRKLTDSPSDKKRQTILIWDLDETLILFHSLLSGQYADSHSPERAKEASNLGRKWQESILDMCDQHFFFTEIENYDQTTTGALAQWDDHQSLADYDFSSDNLEAPESDDERRKLAYRFRRISQLYSQGVRPLARDMLELQNWNWLYNATDKLTKGWLTHGARLLQQVTASAKSSDEAMQSATSTGSSRSGSGSWQSACGDAFGHSMMDQQLYRLMGRTSGAGSGQLSTADTADVVNVLVTTGQLVPTLGKLLLFKLDGAFKATSVYSARNEGKAHCFDLIRERFGDDCNFVAIGDGAEEQKCAEQRGWPFVKVSLQSQADKTAKVVGQTIAAFPSEGGLLTNMHAEHLTTLFPEA